MGSIILIIIMAIVLIFLYIRNKKATIPQVPQAQITVINVAHSFQEQITVLIVEPR